RKHSILDGGARRKNAPHLQTARFSWKKTNTSEQPLRFQLKQFRTFSLPGDTTSNSKDEDTKCLKKKCTILPGCMVNSC
uniref:Uncharacterized protein n=1 Tax=Anopheles atroparvus TaxID=41427 RepID=A0AAG5CSI3_ANOAO